MDYNNITPEQVRVLRNLKALENLSMPFKKLRTILDSITCFEEEGWFFTDEDYNSYDDDGELECACDVIFSNEQIDNEDPYYGADGRPQYFEGQCVYEIDYCHEGDPNCHPDDDTIISDISVEICVPNELWASDDPWD